MPIRISAPTRRRTGPRLAGLPRVRAPARCPLPAGAQSRAARSGRDPGRTGAGVCGRGDWQDARTHDPDRAYFEPGPGQAVGSPGGHVHQQGSARNEMTGRAVVGQIVEGMPWLGTFLDRGAYPAPPCGARGPETRLHHPGHGRSDPPDQQLIEADNIDEKRWPARIFAAMLDGWKNRELTRAGPARRSRELRRWTRAPPTSLPGTAEGA